VRLRHTLVLFPVALLLAACSDSTAPRGTTVDVAALFAAPSPGEVAAIRAEWAGRTTAAVDVREELSTPFAIGPSAGRLRVLSHLVDGQRHVGAVVAPADAAPGSLPVLVYAHGGDAGVSVDELGLLFLGLGAQADDYVWVVPAFRAEPLRVGTQVFTAQGPASPWDRDVDDALSLLSVVVAQEPAADPERVAVLGLSRGAGVGLLMGARDPRIDAVVAFFGPTDFFDPWTQDIVEDALDGRPRDLPGLSWLDAQFIQPLRRGERTTAEVRRELVRRSVVLFASSLPAVQLHHGTADAVVSISQAQRLDAVMRGLGRSAPGYAYFSYPGAGHNPFEMIGSTGRAASFIAEQLGAR
jgi:dipeptidyl aminopeptidase/acylaminoacyl peptidase